jgi:hypothetical protein
MVQQYSCPHSALNAETPRHNLHDDLYVHRDVPVPSQLERRIHRNDISPLDKDDFWHLKPPD